MVPLLVICHECGAILYEGEELKPPYEIIESYDGKCPNCGKKLSYMPKNAEVRPPNETNRLSRLKKRRRR